MPCLAKQHAHCDEAETDSSATPDFAECESTLGTPQKPHRLCYMYCSKKMKSDLVWQRHSTCQMRLFLLHNHVQQYGKYGAVVDGAIESFPLFRGAAAKP
jgi:hypothetical protein